MSYSVTDWPAEYWFVLKLQISEYWLVSWFSLYIESRCVSMALESSSSVCIPELLLTFTQITYRLFTHCVSCASTVLESGITLSLSLLLLPLWLYCHGYWCLSTTVDTACSLAVFKRSVDCDWTVNTCVLSFDCSTVCLVWNKANCLQCVTEFGSVRSSRSSGGWPCGESGRVSGVKYHRLGVMSHSSLGTAQRWLLHICWTPATTRCCCHW